MSKPLFIYMVGPDGQTAFEFDQEVIKIGSLETSHIVVAAANRMHAIIETTDSVTSVMDLDCGVQLRRGGGTGTVDRVAVLKDCDILEIGKARLMICFDRASFDDHSQTRSAGRTS